MRRITAIFLGSVAAAMLATPAFAQCDKVKGKMTEVPVDPFAAPNDPFGRTVVSAQGNLAGTGTAILTSVGPGPSPGTLGATSRHVLVFSPADQLIAVGVLVFTPIPNTPNVSTTLTLTIVGGHGKFAGATGTIEATGTGFNFFPLPPGPSTANASSFEYTFSGQICAA
jgi:hypothetical protein